MDTDRNRRALDLIAQLGAESGLTVRSDPPRVGSKAKSPANDVQVIKAAYSTNRYKVRNTLVAERKTEASVTFLDQRPGPMPGSVTLTARTVVFTVMWPEVHPSIQSYMHGAEFEVWGTMGGITVLVERGSYSG